MPDRTVSHTPDPAIKRLRWRCRRGMKEMDALLLRYLDQVGDQVPVATMARLLDTQDDVLWQWLLGRAAPEDLALAQLIAQIRNPGIHPGDAVAQRSD